MPGKSVIQKTILDLHFNGQPDSFMLQQQVGAWCRTTLADALAAQLDRLDTGAIVRIDSLEIDVATNAEGRWLDDLVPAITRQLIEKSASAAKTTIDQRKSDAQAFVYFLQQGTLPWWYTDTQQVLFTTLQQTSFTADDRALLVTLAKTTPAQERLALLPTEVFRNVIHQLSLTALKVWTDLLDTTGTGEPVAAVARLRKLAAQSVLEHIDIADPRIQAATIHAAFAERVTTRQTPREDAQDLRRPAVDGLQLGTQQADTPHEPVTTGRDALYIRNAGLVIAAPFLPALFANVGLLADGAIVDVNKAVCLVGYLAAGDVAEADLALAKILCGVTPDVVVDTAVVLDAAMMTEATNVLLSVVEHWRVLKDTSVPGLREAFLQREGRLLFDGGAWHLLVEQRAYDMLLQQLPWNISMIKHSWMPYRLMTEWIF